MKTKLWIVAVVLTVFAVFTGCKKDEGLVPIVDYSDDVVEVFTWAKNNGIIGSSTKINDYSPFDQITNVELAFYMKKYIQTFFPNYYSNKMNAQTSIAAFADMPNYSFEAKETAGICQKLGILGLNSNGTANRNFEPEKKLTKKDLFTIMYRLLFGPENDADVMEEMKKAFFTTTSSGGNDPQLKIYALLVLKKVYEAETWDFLKLSPSETQPGASVQAGQLNAPLCKINIRAGLKDVSLYMINLSYSGLYSSNVGFALETIKLVTSNGLELAFTSSQPGTSLTLSLSSKYIIKAGDTIELTFKSNIKGDASYGSTYTFGVYDLWSSAQASGNGGTPSYMTGIPQIHINTINIVK